MSERSLFHLYVCILRLDRNYLVEIRDLAQGLVVAAEVLFVGEPLPFAVVEIAAFAVHRGVAFLNNFDQGFDLWKTPLLVGLN